MAIVAFMTSDGLKRKLRLLYYVYVYSFGPVCFFLLFHDYVRKQYFADVHIFSYLHSEIMII